MTIRKIAAVVATVATMSIFGTGVAAAGDLGGPRTGSDRITLIYTPADWECYMHNICR